MRRDSDSLHRRPGLRRLGALALVLSAAAATLTGQERSLAPTVRFIPLDKGSIDRELDIPAAPNAPVPTSPRNAFPRLPIGHGTMVAPDSPPTPPPTVTGGPGAPCSPTEHQKTVVSVAPPGSTSVISSPSAALRSTASGSTVLFTHNWRAARSTDGGATFTLINPNTKFAAIDGGFCCNQRVTYSPDADITIWLLQYSYSSTTQQGSVRVAIADGDNLNAGASGTWHSYEFDPSDFGHPAGNRLNLNDLVVTRNHLYVSAGVYTGTGSFVEQVIWKCSLAELKAAQGLQTPVWGLGGFGHHFAQGATTTMFAATHLSSTSMRLYQNDDATLSSPLNFIDRTIPAWTPAGVGGYVANAPNGTNWLARVSDAIDGGYANCDEYGFMWTAAQNGTDRPLPYIRIAKFRTSDHSLVGSDDIWANSVAYAYPACTTNLAGHVGYLAAYGEGNGNPGGIHPSSFFAMRDACAPVFSGSAGFTFLRGSSSPTAAQWGDYFTVQRDPFQPLKFAGTGMAMAGGGGGDNQRPTYVLFGREQDAYENRASVGIKSTPVEGATIVLFSADVLGKTSVVTQGYASYPTFDFYALRAPTTFVSDGTVYEFSHWRHASTPYGALTDEPGFADLVKTLDLDSHQAEAVYTEMSTTRVSITSRNPGSGMEFLSSRPDVTGQSNGTTPFDLYYEVGSGAVSLFPTNNFLAFNRWYINGVAQPRGEFQITLTIGSSDFSVEAEYCTVTNGSFASFGAGCVGSNGRVPRHFCNSAGIPGKTLLYQVADAPDGTEQAALVLGFSNTLWDGIPLPLSLGIIGADPTCNLLAEPFFTSGFQTVAGDGLTLIPLPSFLPPGTKIYSQVLCVDFGVSAPLKLIVSDGLELTTGSRVCP